MKVGMKEEMLGVERLNFRYKGQQRGREEHDLFRDLSLFIGRGEFVSLIGPSGSGKSTLFKLIAGLLEPASGTIRLNNGDPSESRLGRVGYMPQQDLLLPWRTVLENCLLPLEVAGVKGPRDARRREEQQVMELLDRFGLAGVQNAYPHELSGGMRQRAALARTITSGQELLLLDEPFGALDAMTKRGMHRWLLELWSGLGKTVLFITHDLEEALLLSDRLYVLGAGPAVGMAGGTADGVVGGAAAGVEGCAVGDIADGATSGGAAGATADDAADCMDVGTAVGMAASLTCAAGGLLEVHNPLPRPRDYRMNYRPEFIQMRQQLEQMLDA